MGAFPRNDDLLQSSRLRIALAENWFALKEESDFDILVKDARFEISVYSPSIFDLTLMLRLGNLAGLCIG